MYIRLSIAQVRLELMKSVKRETGYEINKRNLGPELRSFWPAPRVWESSSGRWYLGILSVRICQTHGWCKKKENKRSKRPLSSKQTPARANETRRYIFAILVIRNVLVLSESLANLILQIMQKAFVAKFAAGQNPSPIRKNPISLLCDLHLVNPSYCNVNWRTFVSKHTVIWLNLPR